MNSLSGNESRRPSSSSASLNSYQFDFDLGLSGRGAASSRPLKDQKPPPASAPAPAAPTPSWTPQPNKPSWTHQPAPAARSGLTDTPSSMVGDIFGKSWASAAPSSTSRIGIPDKNPNLFGDLLGSALGQSKASAAAAGNVPLKASAPRNSYSMDSLSDSLPKTTPATTTTTASNNPMKPSWRSTDNLNNYPSAMKSSPAAPMKTKKDPFESLVGFGSKPAGNPPLSSVKPAATGTGGGSDYSFAAFQNATADDFAKPAQVFPPPPAFQNANTNAFGMPPQPQPKQEKSGMDPLDMLFSSPSPASSTTAASTPAVAPEINDWDLGSEFGGNDSSGVGTTTELEGLPPPPVGVTASAAKTKGLDNYKQGQYADAIKWLTWAVVLFDKSGDSSGIIEVLSCRASCYKEVGEYKKAVADCSKVLEDDSTNVSVLLQRALLYESTEKYKLGAEDLRMVLKIDSGNRLARSTIHRLNKLAD